MVNVGDKPESLRTAVASGRVTVNESTFALIKNGGMKKGDVLAVAQVAGIMAAKRTPDIIPMCHPILIDGIDIRLELDETRRSVEMKFEEYCEYVLELKERRGAKHSTIVRYSELTTRIYPAIGHMKLRDIRADHLNMLYTANIYAHVMEVADKKNADILADVFLKKA